jgi:hypothetical protein
MSSAAVVASGGGLDTSSIFQRGATRGSPTSPNVRRGGRVTRVWAPPGRSPASPAKPLLVEGRRSSEAG